MFQPFLPFSATYIPRLRSLKKRFLVTQTYNRAIDPWQNETKTPLLLTDYDELGSARMHKNAVKNDKYAAIIDLELDAHREKLNAMLRSDSRYALYWSVVQDAQKLKAQIDDKFKDNMRRYIENNTNWRINRDTTIYPNVEVTFGELYITIKHGSQTIRTKLEEIEKS